MSIRTSGQEPDSCSWSTITGLSGIHEPEQMMAQFCAGQLGTSGATFGAHSRFRSMQGGSAGQLYPLYVFSGPSDPRDTNCPDNPCYAQRFAQFIIDHDLGEVVASPVAKNIRFHEGRPTQAFIWMPNETRLSGWWGEYQQKHPRTPEGRW